VPNFTALRVERAVKAVGAGTVTSESAEPVVTLGAGTSKLATAKLAKMKVAPDGSFPGAATPEAATSIRVRGKLKGRRITGGRAELSVGPCSGSARFTAERA
jgi:hypothetical protein